VRAKAKSLVRLFDGEVIQLGAAVRAGRLRIVKRESYSKRLDAIVVRKYALDPRNPDELWDVSQKMRCSCTVCGAWPVPEAREVYAHPVCYQCLPAPTPLPTAPGAK